MAGKRMLVVVILALVSAVAWADAVPETVSPGRVGGVARIADACPTFSWGAVSGSQGYELVVYELQGTAEAAGPALSARISGSALSWTPSLDECLVQGGRYAWFVRTVGSRGFGAWSAGRMFEIVTGPTIAEVEQALRVLERFMAVGGGEGRDRGEGGGVSLVEQKNSGADLESALEATADGVGVEIAETAITIGGVEVVTTATDQDTLARMSCADGQLTKWNASLAAWECGEDESGASYLAGNQLTLDGSTFNVVEGSGSGLEADTLDGQDSSAFAATLHMHSGGDVTSGTVAEPRIDALVARDGEILPTVLAGDGSGSGLDADLLDGQEASSFATAEHGHEYAGTVEVGPSGDFASIQAAIDSISDASSSSRHLIRVAPGTYAEQVTMKPFVDVEGAGAGLTTITSPGSDLWESGTVIGGASAELRSVSVENTGGANYATSVFCAGGSQSYRDIAVESFGSVSNFGFLIEYGNPTILNADVSLPSGGVGLYVQGAATVENSTITVTGGGIGVDAARNYSLLVLRRVEISASGTGSAVILGEATGPYASNHMAVIDQSDLGGGTSSLEVASHAYALITSSIVRNAVTGSWSNLSCLGVYKPVSVSGEEFLPLDHNCQTLPAGSTANADTLDGLDSSAFVRTIGDTMTGQLTLQSDLALFGKIVKGGVGFLADDGASGNLALGREALQSNTTGANNTAVGFKALRNKAGEESRRNTALGAFALHSTYGISDYVGGDNTAVGYKALYASTSEAYSNTAIGSRAMMNAGDGYANTAVGSFALHEGGGNRNTALGDGALYSSTSSGNTAVGNGAMFRSSDGLYNVAVGSGALRENISGDDNTALGKSALRSALGSGNVAVGYRAGSSSTTGSNNIFIANEGLSSDSGVIKIGIQGTQAETYIAGIHGSTVSGGPVAVDATGRLGVGTFGTGSGLDADTLDELHAGQLLRSDFTDSFTSGSLTMEPGTSFHVEGSLSLPLSGISGAGPGSGLNADRLDGSHASAFMAAGTDDWVNTSGDVMTGRLTVTASVVGDETLAVVKGSGTSPSGAAVGVLNTTDYGEAAWFKLSDTTNTLPVLKLVLESGSSSDFLRCDLGSNPTCRIDKNGAFISRTFRLQPTDSPPSCGAVGKGGLYYDTSLDEICLCNGSSWRQLDGGGGC